MIFASLGTTDMEFPRMAKAVDEFAASIKDEVIVQTGNTQYNYQYAKAFDVCTKVEMQAYVDRADILILQGGWGAISEAMEKKKRIVAMPRFDKLEHIHDQVQLIKKLDELGCVVGVFDEKYLPAMVQKAYTHEYQYLPKGDAEGLIRAKIAEWFKK